MNSISENYKIIRLITSFLEVSVDDICLSMAVQYLGNKLSKVSRIGYGPFILGKSVLNRRNVSFDVTMNDIMWDFFKYFSKIVIN